MANKITRRYDEYGVTFYPKLPEMDPELNIYQTHHAGHGWTLLARIYNDNAEYLWRYLELLQRETEAGNISVDIGKLYADNTLRRFDAGKSV